MTKGFWVGFAAASLIASAFLASSQAWAAPLVESFGSLPSAEVARLSPDGKHLAIVRAYDGRNKVAFFDLTKPGSEPYVAGLQDAAATNVYWKTNGRAICIFRSNLTQVQTKETDTWSRALSVDPETHAQVVLMSDAPNFKSNFNVAAIADMAANDPNHVFMTEVDGYDHGYLLDLYRVDITTGAAEMVLHGDTHTIEFLMDGDGHVVGQIDQNADLTNHLIVGSNDVFQYPVKGSSEIEIEGVVGKINPVLAAKKTTPFGTAGLYSWTGSGFTKALFENRSYDLDSTIEDERTGSIIGVTYVDDIVRVKYFDPAMQKVQSELEALYPGQSALILSKDDAGSNYVVLTEGPRNPPVLSLYSASTHLITVIDQAYESLKPAELAEARAYPYKARDGLDIHAYLTLPPGREAHNLPVVVFPHGGPEDRSSLTFDYRAQFLATRGYAVFQPNFRGSSGYGQNFIKAGDGEWAGKVQYDVQDGVKKLIADGIADPKRICIIGASYGGYMALAGATYSPDLYACAVSFAGPSDLDQMLYTGTAFESETLSIWKRRTGADADNSRLAEESPANFADRVKIPILLIHCDKDITVPIAQSEIEEKALQKAGKQVEFVTLEGDDHQLEYAATRIRFLKEVERFLAAHIGT